VEHHAGSETTSSETAAAHPAAFEAKVLAFVEYFNQTMAKPFKGIYQGRAFAA
jgi:hypothetical protein